jgi:hypothetical protein
MRAIAFLLEDETKNNLKIETDMAVHLARVSIYGESKISQCIINLNRFEVHQQQLE